MQRSDRSGSYGKYGRGPVLAADLGATVAESTTFPAGTVHWLTTSGDVAARACAIIVPAVPVDTALVRQLDEHLKASKAERLWISRREDWTRALAGLPWLPLVPAPPDGGHGVVAVAGVAVPLAEAATAFAAGAPELAPETIIARGTAERLAR